LKPNSPKPKKNLILRKKKNEVQTNFIDAKIEFISKYSFEEKVKEELARKKGENQDLMKLLKTKLFHDESNLSQRLNRVRAFKMGLIKDMKGTESESLSHDVVDIIISKLSNKKNIEAVQEYFNIPKELRPPIKFNSDPGNEETPSLPKTARAGSVRSIYSELGKQPYFFGLKKGLTFNSVRSLSRLDTDPSQAISNSKSEDVFCLTETNFAPKPSLNSIGSKNNLSPREALSPRCHTQAQSTRSEYSNDSHIQAVSRMRKQLFKKPLRNITTAPSGNKTASSLNHL